MNGGRELWYLAGVEFMLDALVVVFTTVAVLMLVHELWWFWRRGELRRPRVFEMLASFSPLGPSILAEIGLRTFWAFVYFGLAQFALFDLPVNWWTALLAFVVVDFVFYWEHRFGHEIRFLWAMYHSVHHSSRDFNQAVSYRISFVDQLFAPWLYALPVLLGIPPGLVVATLLVNLAYQGWIHTELIGRLGKLDWLLNTPSNHRVHHGSQPKYLDKNYGGVLMIWDHLFGTYQREEEQPVYGLTKPLLSSNPIRVHFEEIIRLWHDLRAARGVREFLRTLWVVPAAKEG